MKTRKQFIEDKKEECQTNIWTNELNILHRTGEIEELQKQLEKFDAEMKAKGKPLANAEQKQRFVITETIKLKTQEIAKVEGVKAYNEYVLKVLLPKFAAVKKAEISK